MITTRKSKQYLFQSFFNIAIKSQYFFDVLTAYLTLIRHDSIVR